MTTQSFESLRALAANAAKRHSPEDKQLQEDIANAKTATWVLAEERQSSPAVGDSENFGVYVGSNHGLRDVSGPIWVNLTT